MRLRKIEISDFGGFPQAETIDLEKEGKNLLVYGENGSGKSTIFNALDRFFESSLKNKKIKPNRNLFRNNTDPANPLNVRVQLLFGPLVGGEVQDIPANRFEWSDGSNPTGAQLVKDTATLPSRLDYRAILSTHFVHRQNRDVDLYETVVSSLLPGLGNSVSTLTFGSERTKIDESLRKLSTEAPGPIRDAIVGDLQTVLRDHSAGLETLCDSIKTDVRKLLRFFRDGQSVKFKVKSGSYDDATDTLVMPRVLLTATLHKKNIPSHHTVINEARLTSIGLCVYLAAIKKQGESLDALGNNYLKLLVLDDVLIGLDIANRSPVMQILRKEFSDWQIILLTHDRVWFDMVVETIDARNWKVYEAHRSFDVKLGFERPKLVPRLQDATQTKDYLIARANDLLAAHDFRGAAVYARAAFEVWAKKKADKSLAVKYYKDSWRQPINDLWTAIKASPKGQAVTNQPKVLALETSKAIVLNPWSHSAGSAVVAADVQSAVTAVQNLW